MKHLKWMHSDPTHCTKCPNLHGLRKTNPPVCRPLISWLCSGFFPALLSWRGSSNDMSPHAAQGRGAAVRRFDKTRLSAAREATESCATVRQGTAREHRGGLDRVNAVLGTGRCCRHFPTIFGHNGRRTVTTRGRGIWLQNFRREGNLKRGREEKGTRYTSVSSCR